MPKTLADMTPEQRAACIGMWCEVDGQLEILAEPDGMVDYHDTAIMHSVKRNGGSYVLANAITPRFDLPRAWTPDGEPVPGKWLHLRKGDLTGWERGFSAPPDEDKDLVKSLLAVNEPLIRHFVTEWEQCND